MINSDMILINDDRSERVKYNLSDYLIYVNKNSLSDVSDCAVTAHWHDEIELIAILYGNMKYNVNGESFTLSAGEGVFVNSRQLHYSFSELSKCEYICVLLHPLSICATHYIESTYIRPVISNNEFTYKILSSDEKWQKDILDCTEKIYEIYGSKSFVLDVQSLFYRIWGRLYEHLPDLNVRTARDNYQLTVLRDMIGFIQKNYSDKITLNDIAYSANIGKSSCCAIFKNYLNQTPIGYLTNYRLNKSALMLRETDKTITEIALLSGFNGSSYFTEIFGRVFGMNPTEYRKNQSLNQQ